MNEIINHMGHVFIKYDCTQIFGDLMKCETCNLKAVYARYNGDIFSLKSGTFLKLNCNEEQIKKILE